MKQFMRSLFTTVLVLLGLVLVPAVALSASRAGGRDLFSAVAQGTSPLPTPTNAGSTIPPAPTPTPIYTHPHRVHRRPPVYNYVKPRGQMPAPTPAIPSSALQLDGYWVQRVIGDRFSAVIYAFANDWLYRSDNDGRSWHLVTAATPVDAFIMNALDPNVLYSGNGNTCAPDPALPAAPMLKSTDGGVSWFALPNALGMRPLLTSALDPDLVFAADCQWLFLSTDGGNSWTPRPLPSPDALWNRYTVQALGAIYADDGATSDALSWNGVYAGGVADDGSGVVAFSPGSGETWQQSTPNVYPSPWDLTALAVDPFNASRVWFANSEGVWFSPNSGQVWESSTAGLGNVVKRGVAGADAGLNALVLHPNNQLYLGTVRGLYTKPVNGRQWAKISGTAFDYTAITGILFTETNPNRLYLNSAEGVHLVNVGN